MAIRLTATPAIKQDSGALRLLLVDDEKDITFVVKKALQTEGFTVDAFNDPKQALASFDPAKYDIALLDIRMPNMSGFELARELWRRNEKLQVCFFSAFEISQNEAKTTLPSLKSHCFITKPVRPNVLSSHIKSHFAIH